MDDKLRKALSAPAEAFDLLAVNGVDVSNKVVHELRARIRDLEAQLAAEREAVRVLAVAYHRYRAWLDHECSLDRLQADSDVDMNPIARDAVEKARGG